MAYTDEFVAGFRAEFRRQATDPRLKARLARANDSSSAEYPGWQAWKQYYARTASEIEATKWAKPDKPIALAFFRKRSTAARLHLDESRVTMTLPSPPPTPAPKPASPALSQSQPGPDTEWLFGDGSKGIKPGINRVRRSSYKSDRAWVNALCTEAAKDGWNLKFESVKTELYRNRRKGKIEF
jgi:hypothetical protein